MQTRPEMTMFKRSIACMTTAVVLAALSGSVALAQAQGYPNKPIRVFLGYTSGGASDGAMRPLATVPA